MSAERFSSAGRWQESDTPRPDVSSATIATDVTPSVTGQPQHLLLTLLGEFWLGRTEPLPSAALVDLLREFDLSTSNARAALSRLARRGLLAPMRAGRHTAYALTEHGVEVLNDGTQRIFTFGHPAPPWDGTWTVIAFSLPERHRDTRHVLRTRLRWAGFAPRYDGVWFAPGNRETAAATLLHELAIETATILAGPASGPASPQGAWDLEALASRYRAFIGTFTAVHKRARDGLVGAAVALVTRTALIDRWRTFPALDPDLPDELLPHDWPRTAARDLFAETYDTLGPLAAIRFRQLLAPHAADLALHAVHHTARQARRLARSAPK